MVFKRNFLARIIATFLVVIALFASVCQASLYAMPAANITTQSETQQEDVRIEFIRLGLLNLHKKENIQQSNSKAIACFENIPASFYPTAISRGLPIHGDKHYLHILYLF